MTILRDIFEKPVDRPIEGVIKADDDASLRIELEEYVLTNEIKKQIERFLDAYNNYTNANGVWISGFFGSGKSHLLKMLAMLLENREVGGAAAYDLFKDKCADDEILSADLKRAISVPSKSILFNIDQKADVISKDQIDALLSVFQKVFDETCGYYGKQAYIAQFVRVAMIVDGRTPVTGTKLVREWEGTEHTVTVMRDGFEWQGRNYKSLSAIARAITGTRWNGYRFFGLRESRRGGR